MLGTSSCACCSFGVCLVWGMPCRQRGGVACSVSVLVGAGEEGGREKGFRWHLCGFFSPSHPASFPFYADEFRSWTRPKPGPGNFLSLWPPRGAGGRPLRLLINDLPAVYTNFMAFMYAHASSFSPFSQTNPNTTSVKYESQSLVPVFSKRAA